MYSLHGHNQIVQSKSYSMQHKKEINLEKSSIWIPFKNSCDQHSMFIHLRILLFHYPYLYTWHIQQRQGSVWQLNFFILFFFFGFSQYILKAFLFYELYIHEHKVKHLKRPENSIGNNMIIGYIFKSKSR